MAWIQRTQAPPDLQGRRPDLRGTCGATKPKDSPLQRAPAGPLRRGPVLTRRRRRAPPPPELQGRGWRGPPPAPLGTGGQTLASAGLAV